MAYRTLPKFYFLLVGMVQERQKRKVKSGETLAKLNRVLLDHFILE